MCKVSLEEAAKSFPALLEKAINGEEVLILQDQKPVAKLVSVGAEPPSPAKRIQAGSAKGLIEIAADFDAPLEDFKEFME
ncbi:MAG: hypothetical protein DKINENOH_05196 [bacterium]|nr:hypothetical protein [bacterium]